MPDLILHHYPTSPFSEKIRAILGLKKLPWKSVHIPSTLPKPDLIALTGGYRKTPVMQIGRDIYCDSKLIARVIDRLHPQPPLILKSREADCRVQEQWAEQVLFFLIVPIIFQPQGLAHFLSKLPADAIQHFHQDRAELFTGGNARRGSMAVTRNELPPYLSALDTQLHNAPFVLGDTPSIADFSIYHPIWFVLSNPGIADYMAPYPSVRAWAERIQALGHGQPTKFSAAQAIEIARNSPPVARRPSADDPNGIAIGTAVTINATDYGTEPASGALLASTPDEIVILREDERAGELAVHFPRAGFKLTAIK